MKRAVWKWMLGISLAFLVLLLFFTVFIWALVNVASALGDALVNQTETDSLTVNGISFGQFLINSVGSPVFYMYLIDITALTVSSVAMIITHKR